MSLLSIDNLNKFVGEGDNRFHILKNITLNIERGEFVAIVGQSGSGKSTLMNMLGCLDTPTSGSYKVHGMETIFLEADILADLRSRTFGFIFQRYNLLNSLTSIENVALPAVYAGTSHDERMALAKSLLTDFGLADKFCNRPSELSGGQQQRVSIARALMNGGEVILADEPTGALDSKSGEIVMNVLTKLNNNGHTIILVTHNFDIAAYAKRVIEIHDGRIISERYAEKPSTPIFLPPIEIKKNIKHSNFRNLLLESFTMSIQALRAHKLRSMLTMLGIIIGIASVISVVSLGRASEEKILSNIRSLGANTIEIFPGQGFGDMNAGRVKTLSPTDVAILDSQTYLEGASPTITTSGVVVFGSISSNVMVTGVGSKYFRIKGMKTKMGSFFNEADIIANTSVVVIDHKARASLFPNGENPIGKVIFFNMSPLEIIGVAQKQEGPDYSTNPTIWIPYSTVMYKISGTHEIDSIVVKVHDGINSQIAEKNITILLTLSHDGMKDFFTFNVDSIKLAIEKTTNTMTLLISCIALISLIVGGIGVMNIMLVSVTERTSEIGVRMAIGAKRRNILTQFLIEAVLICLCGGIIGIVFSTLLIPTANMFFDELSLSYSPSSIIVALCCSTFVGVFFGFVPARNASRLSPIDALARDY